MKGFLLCIECFFHQRMESLSDKLQEKELGFKAIFKGQILLF